MKTKNESNSNLLDDEFNELRPQLIKEAEGNSVRCRLAQIENEYQPGTKDNNAIHVELFDRLKIGKLNRDEKDIIFVGDGDENEVENGIFLCGRSSKDIKVFHSESDRKWPTCKKCSDITSRLLAKNLTMFLLSKKEWRELQNLQYELTALRWAQSTLKIDPYEFIKNSEILDECHKNELTLNFNTKGIELIDLKKGCSVSGTNLKDVFIKYKKAMT